MLTLDSNIQYIKGVGEKRARLFNSLGVFDADSLIHFYPRKYEDWSLSKSIAEIPSGETAAIKATLVTPVREAMIRKGLTLYKCRFSDGESIVNVTIFNNKYLARSLVLYEDYILYGKIEKNLATASMSSPKIEKAGTAGAIHPIYPAKEKLTSNAVSKVIKTALESLGEIPETLSCDIRKKYGLITLDKAIRDIHFPKTADDYMPARKRLIFEELLTLQLGLLKMKSAKKRETAMQIRQDYSKEFEGLLPFMLTNAQKRTIADCTTDMAKKCPMSRLIQGDVGSGKTAVAASLTYTVIKNGFQAAMMAPTEILASQHFESISKMFKGTGIKTALLTGSTPAKEKREIKKSLLNGEIDFIIGTHAVIQNDVGFKSLALVITDEQHRFGVKQRGALADKGENPHTLVMSATPIPRTLGLILYGDLDISIIDELPPGRQKIRTDVVTSAYSKRLYNFIKEAIDRGEQAYIVCPAVDENDTALKSAEELAQELANGDFYGYNLGILHGKMKAKEKEAVMRAFADGDIKLLVATTVVEVGVDVQNATIMVVEDADRFGLSTLHQLRGRVGRGNKKSFCVLVSDSKSEAARERLLIMKQYSDGFKLADADLKMRGPGDFFGARQHGLPELKIADMLTDTDMLESARECAMQILEKDFALERPENLLLSKQLDKMFSDLVG